MSKIHMMSMDELICWQVSEPDLRREALLDACMAEYGWVLPVVVDAAGGVLLGQERVDAGKRAGHKECPCVFKEFLSAVQYAALENAETVLSILPWAGPVIYSLEDHLEKVGLHVG